MELQNQEASNDTVFGINEPKLDALVVEIGEIAERIKTKFTRLEEIAAETSSFYECESGTNFRNSFAKLSQNFSIVTKNILCYSSDLVRVKGRLYSTSDTISENLTLEKGNVLSNSIDRYIGKF